MTIDIDRLTESELVELNHKVVARLRFLHQMRAHSTMLDFKIGDCVDGPECSFAHSGPRR